MDIATAAGVGTGEADLWCTYAATRTMAWLGRVDQMVNLDGTIGYLRSRQNSDGGYAWAKGMVSDAWATFYCTQAIKDIGAEPTRTAKTAQWLRKTWSGQAYGMLPGQHPDVWATHFSTRTVTAVCADPVPDSAALAAWLRSLQCEEGGLCWTPSDASCGNADVRACYYGVMAWRALSAGSDEPPPWDAPKLVAWLRRQQDSAGGFRFAESVDVPCLWATYRAVGALAALGGAPTDPASCVAWIMRLRGSTGAFVRWAGYDVEDVWASFCAIGSLRLLDVPLAPVADAVVARLAELACPGGGYTYREPAAAADALTTSALLLAGDIDAHRREELRRWLEHCQMPNEGGIMYMPGRGSEVRCTLWALAAGAFGDDPAARARIARWLSDLQNPDGGFGSWEGRGSDMVSTASAVEILRLLDVSLQSAVDMGRLRLFVRSCAAVGGHGNVPGAEPTLRAGLQAARVLSALDENISVASLLDRHRVCGGGFANEGNRLPDLLSTFESVLAADRAGLRVDTEHAERFLRSVDRSGGTAWTPLSPDAGGPLADCAGALLTARLAGDRTDLPALALS